MAEQHRGTVAVTCSLVVIHIIYSQLITEVTHDSIEGHTAMNGLSGHHDERIKDSPSMHRQHMVTVLEGHLPASCRTHPRKRLVNYFESKQGDAHSTSPIGPEFADGTTATTDVLIGADGVRLAFRKTMFEAASTNDSGNDKADLKKYIDATFTGMSIYRSLVSAETLREENPENISLKGFTLVSV